MPSTATRAMGSTSGRDSTDTTQPKTSSRSCTTDQFGNIRRISKLEELATGFKFEAFNGVKRLVQFSNSTATAVKLEAPLIELDLFNARQLVRRKEIEKGLKKGTTTDAVRIPTHEIVKTEFPRLANWFYDEEIRKAVFENRHESTHDWVVQVISDRLDMTPQTIAKYWRGRRSTRPPKV